MPQWSASAETNTPANAFKRLPFVAILAAYFVIAIIYSIVTPSFEASDELWHYPFVKRLADGQGLPVQRADQIGPWRQEGSQPPLYYALGALFTWPVDTSDMDSVRWLNPHADIGVPKADRNANMVVHPLDEFPYTGTLLAVHIVRWFSVILGGITVLAAYLLARQIFADELLALTTAAVTAFNAMFLFITSSVNNDALLISLSALALWLMVRFIAGRPSALQWFGLGIILGLACLTKTSALALTPLAALTAAVIAVRYHSWDDFIYAGFALLLPVLLISGWWYWRNWQLYHDPLGLNAFVAIVGPRYPVPTLRQLMGEWKGFVMSYWGFFGGVNVPAPGWYYWAMSLLALFGFAGAPLYLWRQYKQKAFTGRRWWQLALTVIFPIVVFIALIRWTLMTIASQGRLMFPAITLISLWIAMGWVGLFRSRLRLVVPVSACSFMAITAVIMPFTVIKPAYALPTTVDVSQMSPQNELNVNYGDQIRLVGYDLAPSELAPGEPVAVTLYWQALAPIADDYTAFVHVLTQDDLIVGQRDRYPGQGNYPTSLWQPGEAFSDTVIIPTDTTMLTPNSLRVETGFYKLSDGSRLPITESASETLSDAAVFGFIDVPIRQTGGIPNPMYVDFGGQIALVGYELDHTSARPGEAVHLTLYWQAQTDIHKDYAVFTHILGREERMLAQKDGWPQGGLAPTSTWKKSQLIKDSYELVVASDAAPEVAEVEIGLYDAEVKRLPILGEGGYVQGTRLVLGKFRILSPEAN
ncbi:MAG: glycosyltransferase family 39 protein [Chloroflexi bacterium]|nr:glycosyltransferase family 39 protein [Chloroflexota bacterium]